LLAVSAAVLSKGNNMSATGYTPIQLYYSTTASAVPLAANLISGELALNVTDGRLYYKDNAGTVQLLSTSTTANGTANGVLYLNGSKVATSGSALWFDGTNFGVGTGGNTLNQQSVIYKVGANAVYHQVANGSTGLGATNGVRLGVSSGGTGELYSPTALISYIDNSEQMRLTSTGLGIGTSSLSYTASGRGNVNIAGSAGAILGFQIGGTAKGYVFHDSTLLQLWNETGGIILGTAGATRATLDSSGNLGLGVTPSAWASATGLQVQYAAVEGRSALPSYGTFSANGYTQAGVWKYIASDYASRYTQYQGAHLWYTAASGTAGNAITFTQAMTLDASGNLGIGATSPSARFHVTTSDALVALIATSRGSGGYTQFNLGANGAAIGFIGSAGQISTTGGANDFALRAENNLLFLASGNTERARIDTSGNFLVGPTSFAYNPTQGATISGGSIGAVGIGHASGTATGNGYVNFAYNGSNIGSITQSGTTAVLYNVTSDYRLKTVIGPVADAGQRIDALQPIEYTWNADGSRTRGFLAHQFQEVYASSVSGTKDAVDAEGKPVYQSMQASTSEVIADLVAEIQSLRARVAALEN
jgi:hypothetical protein